MPTATPREGLPRNEHALCAITGQRKPRRDLVDLEAVRPSLSDRIRREHPHLPNNALISREEIGRYRAQYVEELLREEVGELSELDLSADLGAATVGAWFADPLGFSPAVRQVEVLVGEVYGLSEAEVEAFREPTDG